MRNGLLLLAVALASPLAAQTQRDSIISVSASRATRIAADQASLYLVVEGAAETTADAIARVGTKVTAVTNALKSFAPHVRLDAPVSYGVGPSPGPNGYPVATSPVTNLARSVIRVQLDRLDQVATVIAAAMAAGATSTSSLTFEASAADSVRRSRINEAMAAVRLDADAIAASLGGRLGSLVSVSSTGNSFPFQGPGNLNFDSRFGQPAQAPDVQITTTVTVQFRLLR